MSYRFPGNLRVELNYIRFDKEQKAIYINYLEEKKLVISRPFRGDKFSAFSRLTLNQFTLSNTAKKSKFTSAEFLLSAVAFGISSNLTTYAIINDFGVPLAFSNMAMTFRFQRESIFYHKYNMNIITKKISLVKAEVEKSMLKRGSINLFYEMDLKNNNYTMGLGFRFNLSVTQAAFSGKIKYNYRC